MSIPASTITKFMEPIGTAKVFRNGRLFQYLTVYRWKIYVWLPVPVTHEVVPENNGLGSPTDGH